MLQAATAKLAEITKSVMILRIIEILPRPKRPVSLNPHQGAKASAKVTYQRVGPRSSAPPPRPVGFHVPDESMSTAAAHNRMVTIIIDFSEHRIGSVC